MSNQRRVLIVDQSEETFEVLQTALKRRGIETFAARRPNEGDALAKELEPDLIVLDMEAERPRDEGVLDSHLTGHAEREIPIILLGSVRRRSPAPIHGEFVSKPYHYAPLIRKIEELLENAPPSEVAGERAA